LQHPVSHNRSYSFSGTCDGICQTASTNLKTDYAKLAILAPFMLTRVYREIGPAKAIKRAITQTLRAQGFAGGQLLELWVSVARVNHLLFRNSHRRDELYALDYLIKEAGAYVQGYERATPNYHVGLHLAAQIYFCTSSSVRC